MTPPIQSPLTPNTIARFYETYQLTPVLETEGDAYLPPSIDMEPYTAQQIWQPPNTDTASLKEEKAAFPMESEAGFLINCVEEGLSASKEALNERIAAYKLDWSVGYAENLLTDLRFILNNIEYLTCYYLKFGFDDVMGIKRNDFPIRLQRKENSVAVLCMLAANPDGKEFLVNQVQKRGCLEENRKIYFLFEMREMQLLPAYLEDSFLASYKISDWDLATAQQKFSLFLQVLVKIDLAFCFKKREGILKYKSIHKNDFPMFDPSEFEMIEFILSHAMGWEYLEAIEAKAAVNRPATPDDKIIEQLEVLRTLNLDQLTQNEMAILKGNSVTVGRKKRFYHSILNSKECMKEISHHHSLPSSEKKKYNIYEHLDKFYSGVQVKAVLTLFLSEAGLRHIKNYYPDKLTQLPQALPQTQEAIPTASMQLQTMESITPYHAGFIERSIEEVTATDLSQEAPERSPPKKKMRMTAKKASDFAALYREVFESEGKRLSSAAKMYQRIILSDECWDHLKLIFSSTAALRRFHLQRPAWKYISDQKIAGTQGTGTKMLRELRSAQGEAHLRAYFPDRFV